MNEAPAVLLDFGALFARKSDSQIVKVGLDRTMFLNEAVNNSFEENAVGEHFVIEHQIETTISTIQEKFYRNSYGEEPGAFDLLPFRGVLTEISERCAGKLAVVSSPLLPPECTKLLDEYELTNTVIPLVSQIKDGVTGTLLTRYRKLIDWNIITLTFISDFGNACAQINISPINCILVSENLQHIVAGKEAGVQTVGVLTREESALSALGDTNATILEFYRAGADHVIRSGLSELLDLIVFVDPAPLKHASESQYQYATFAHGMCPLWEKPPRIGTVQYTSRKSGVSCAVNLDGTGLAHISTGVSFLDYVIALLAQYGRYLPKCLLLT